jgi:hypothetical protein
MTKHEAHLLLDKRKQGLAVPQYLVNRALVVSGDIAMACPPCKTTRMEGTSMAQGEGTRGLSYPFMAWDNPGFNQRNEGTQ